MAKKKSEEHSGADANDSDYQEEPNFDDPPGFVDNISDEGENHRLPAQHTRRSNLNPCAVCESLHLHI